MNQCLLLRLINNRKERKIIEYPYDKDSAIFANNSWRTLWLIFYVPCFGLNTFLSKRY